MRSLVVAIVAGLVVAVAAGCGPTSDPIAEGSTGETMGAELDDLDLGEDFEGDVGDVSFDDAPLIGADDSVPALPDTSTLMAGYTKARASANVNLRRSATTSSSILAVIPSGATVSLVSSTLQSGFYNVTYNGITGFAHANYLKPVSDAGSGGTTSPVSVDGPASPANTIARAKAAVGFSYYWGGGAWLASGPTASTKGTCRGSCPSCTHTGRYGADCSGFVAKAWQYGNKTLSVNSHPYSTADFNVSRKGLWSIVSRGSLRTGDALVQRTGSSGHIVIYEKGDGWGAPTVYECRGCAYGCVYNARTFSGYKAIRRAGF